MCSTSKCDISPIKPHVTANLRQIPFYISSKNKKRSKKTLNRVKFSHVPFSFKQIKKGKKMKCFLPFSIYERFQFEVKRKKTNNSICANSPPCFYLSLRSKQEKHIFHPSKEIFICYVRIFISHIYISVNGKFCVYVNFYTQFSIIKPI